MIKLNLQQFGAPGLTTALRAETFENLQLNAGIMLANFDLSEIDTATELATAISDLLADPDDTVLGATRGGGNFVVTRDIREPEIDGRRYPFKGGKFVDSADARLTTTLVEITPGNIVKALGNGESTTTNKKTTIKMHTVIKDTDYLQNIVWIGDIADGRMVAIELINALNTSDFNFTYTDKGEGTLAVEFHAHQENVDDYDEAPYNIFYYDTDTSPMSALTVASAAGSTSGKTALTISGYTPGSGESYLYKVGDTVPTIDYHAVPDYTWNAWDGSSDIAATTGKKIAVVSVSSGGKVVAYGSATVTSHA